MYEDVVGMYREGDILGATSSSKASKLSINSGALRTRSRQKTRIEHQHSRTHIMKAINETNFIVLVDVLT